MTGRFAELALSHAADSGDARLDVKLYGGRFIVIRNVGPDVERLDEFAFKAAAYQDRVLIRSRRASVFTLILGVPSKPKGFRG
jgi:hypothetical protein